MSKSTDRIIDLIDAGLGQSAEGGYGEIHPESCARCVRRDPAEGSDFCEPCRAFLLGDGPDPTDDRYALADTFVVAHRSRPILDALPTLHAQRGGLRFTAEPGITGRVDIGSPGGHLHLELEMQPPSQCTWVWAEHYAGLIGTLLPFDHHLHFTVARVQLEDWDHNWYLLAAMVERRLVEWCALVPKVVRLTVDPDGAGFYRGTVGGIPGGINVTLEWSSCDPAFVEHSQRRNERHLAERYDAPLPPWWTESTI